MTFLPFASTHRRTEFYFLSGEKGIGPIVEGNINPIEKINRGETIMEKFDKTKLVPERKNFFILHRRGLSTKPYWFFRGKPEKEKVGLLIDNITNALT